MHDLRIYDLIAKKRDGHALTAEEIRFFVRSFTDGSMADYQASALLMAVVLRGMAPKETALLTEAMRDSGAVIDLKSVPGVKVDKHSTGGVGDGVSLVLAPLVACHGVPVPMMSGRGLGHTGGTLDKLESIPGFRTDLGREQFVSQLAVIGCAMIGQTAEVAPADKKMYALRDVTGTVESIPLICASILSKKLAEGADALVLDVKTGDGAFMREKKEAAALARAMVDIGRRCGKKMAALITDMDRPLGRAVGNALEARQAVEILQGKEEPATRDFIELTEELGGWMLCFGRAAKSVIEGKKKIAAARKNGAGLKKFEELVRAQGGNAVVCADPQKVLPRAQKIKMVLSPWKGTLSELRARAVGVAAALLGAGRERQDSPIDPGAGIVLHKKPGDSVERSEPLAELHYSEGARAAEAERMFLSAVRISKRRPRIPPLIQQVIR